ncbi:DUF3077 domain-containing protein [Pseudomonas sp. RP23018S]|uniref:DUF3077 domain-containing protein n=1 Tax=Pseudomonas sp. RP23018S TaxID=3096037 RepID=UPI002ACA2DFB|nr:DUF3077 domain-containing protein [Pseudomonas sp. RP23018S]MDZ5604080.1 DUF3077 domain-containing protein [Pseudomonas sp. RP23018S]
MSDEPPLNVTLGIRQLSKAGKSAAAMFQVLPGVPFEEAYEHVSVLLSYIQHLVAEGDLQDDHKLLGAAGYLSAVAKAIMDDIEIARCGRA